MTVTETNESETQPSGEDDASTEQPQQGSASTGEGTAASGPAATLPGPVIAVLAQVAQIAGQRSGSSIDPDRVARDAAAVPHLLELLTGSAGLRTLLRHQLTATLAPTTDAGSEDETAGATADGSARAWACDLLAADQRTAETGADRVRQHIEAERKAARRARRAARNAAAPSETERRAQREQAKLTAAREARDRAQARLVTAEADAAEQRALVVDLRQDLDTLTARLAAAESQLAAARSVDTDPVRAADRLARALTPGTSRDNGNEPPQHADGLDLVAAATTIGLPADVATTVRTWLPQLLTAAVNPPRRAPVTTTDVGLTVDVLGGADIGGSAVLVTAAGTRILIDAGTRPGGVDDTSLAPPRISEALAARLDAVVVTHAHNDHAGWVPRVVAAQPHVPVLTTAATADLLATMWFDAAKVLARRTLDDESWAGGRTPAYGHDDVARAVAATDPVEYYRTRRIGDLTVQLFPAGHIVGAAGVVVAAGDRRVVVSGDVSGPGQKTVGGIELPDSARRADLLLLESTYANMSRPTPRAKAVAEFVSDVRRIVSGGGQVLVPAFALGRAQEIALVLAEHLPDVDVIVDGLARDVSEVYEHHTGPKNTKLRIFTDRVRAVPRGRTRTELSRFGPGVVVATSGMLTAGPAVAWAHKLLPDPRNGLLIVGYQDEDSPGGRLLALADAGRGVFDLPASDGTLTGVQVNAHVSKYGLGAHASADELMSIAADAAARVVMPVHGDWKAREAMRERLQVRRQDTIDARTTWTC